jgi:hypothetical protein
MPIRVDVDSPARPSTSWRAKACPERRQGGRHARLRRGKHRTMHWGPFAPDLILPDRMTA